MNGTRVSFELSVDELDVLDTLAYLEVQGQRWGRRGPTAAAIVRERLTHVLRHDSEVRRLVKLRQRARAVKAGQLRLVRDDD